MIAAYAVAQGLRRRPAATGIDGAPVEMVRHRSLAAIVTRHRAPPARTRDAVLAHAGVCDALMTAAEAVLPVRFGEAFAGETELRASLDDRHEQLVRGLEHVRGRVEIGVRVAWDGAGAAPRTSPPAGNGAGGGRAYLLARVEEEHRRRAVEMEAEAIAGPIHAALAAQAPDSRLEVLPTERLVMSAVYLVERERVHGMVARVQEEAGEHPDLDILCTGPWPPYSFAAGEEIHAR